MVRLAGSVMLLWGWKRAVLAILAGAVAALALPPVGFVAALFVSFTLLIWLLDGATGGPDGGSFSGFGTSFFIGWCFGFGYFVAGLWWLGGALLVEADEFAWALPLAVLVLPAVLALFYGLAAFLAKILWSDGWGRLAALAAGFGVVEWLRGFVATGFPWNAIGYGAMPVPLMMQSAHLVGIYGVSAIAVFVFSAPALIATRRGMRTGLTLAALLACAHLGYGAYRLYGPQPSQEGVKKVTMRLVQPNLDQSEKMDNAARDAIFEDLLRLTALPPEEGMPTPDIVVWPETSIPFILTENPDAFGRIAGVLQKGQILIAGAVRSEDAAAGQAPRYYNSVYVIDDGGQILGASDKVHLTPFGEYVPFESMLRRIGIESLISLPGGFSAAANRTMLELPSGLKFYPLICYEVIFPQEMKAGWQHANAVLNITNDAWFGITPGPYQHLQQARLRAVENGIPVIRDANSGISAFIDAYGRIKVGATISKKVIVDATMSLLNVYELTNFGRKRNFWLIVLSFILLAAISRKSFIKRIN